MKSAPKPCPLEEAERHVRQTDDNEIVVNAGAAGLDNDRATFLLRRLKQRPDVATVDIRSGNCLTVVPHNGLCATVEAWLEMLAKLVHNCIIELRRQLSFAHRTSQLA